MICNIELVGVGKEVDGKWIEGLQFGIREEMRVATVPDGIGGWGTNGKAGAGWMCRLVRSGWEG